MLSIIPTNSLFAGDGIVRRGVAETEWKRHRGAPCRVFWREGEAVRVLPGWLGSKGDAGLALKPPVVEAD